jgi:hypothetical protein
MIAAKSSNEGNNLSVLRTLCGRGRPRSQH